MSNIRHSIELAIARGWKYFPLYGLDSNWMCTCGNSHEFDSSAGKHPLTVNGMKAATSESDRLDDWLERTTNFGVVCNESGFCVLDVDPRNGGFESFEKILEDFPTIVWDTVTASTGVHDWDEHSALGSHYYFAAPEGMLFKANLGPKYPGIDIKHNGYVVLPGSRHVSRTYYQWEKSPASSELKPFPEELYDLALRSEWPPQPKPVPAPPPRLPLGPENSKYGLKALEDQCRQLSRVPEGRRNSELFNSGLRMGSLVASGHLTLSEAHSQLVQTGLRMGLDEKEVRQTLSRASGDGSLQLGMANPRGPLPESNHSIASEGNKPAETVRSSLLSLVDWEFAFTNSEEVNWLVPGVIAEGRGHALYSAPGLGKSLLAIEIAACLAAGKSLLGFEARGAVRVLYLDQENNVSSDVVPRLKAMGFSASELSNLSFAPFPEIGPLDGRGGFETMERILDEHSPELVIFDTLARFVEGEENSNNTWNNFYVNVGVPLKRRGIAYIRLDHSGKNEDQGMRGGSAKQGDLDLIWRMKPGTDEKTFLLSNEKSRLPLDSKKLKLIRVAEPVLGHELTIEAGGFSFAKLIQTNELFVKAQEMIKNVDSETGSLLGQKKMWEKLKSASQELGLRQNLFNEAHKAVRGGQEDVRSSD